MKMHMGVRVKVETVKEVIDPIGKVDGASACEKPRRQFSPTTVVTTQNGSSKGLPIIGLWEDQALGAQGFT